MLTNTIYNLPYPKELEDEVLEILKNELYENRDFRRDYTRLFSRIYLIHIAPHEKRATDIDMAVMRFMSCGICVARVWAYFRERYKTLILEWKAQI